MAGRTDPRKSNNCAAQANLHRADPTTSNGAEKFKPGNASPVRHVDGTLRDGKAGRIFQKPARATTTTHASLHHARTSRGDHHEKASIAGFVIHCTGGGWQITHPSFGIGRRTGLTLLGLTPLCVVDATETCGCVTTLALGWLTPTDARGHAAFCRPKKPPACASKAS